MIGSRFRPTLAIAVLIVAAATTIGGVGYSLVGDEEDATVSAVTSAPTRYTASGDKLIPIPDNPGSYWIDERLVIFIELDVADPDAAIAGINQLYGGAVVERYPDLRTYRVRFDGRGPEELETLSREIGARDDVDLVIRDVQGPGLSLFSADRPSKPSD